MAKELSSSRRSFLKREIVGKEHLIGEKKRDSVLQQVKVGSSEELPMDED